MKIITLESVGSTNDYCLDHPGILASPGTAVRAIDQTKGRGRHSKSWSFAAGKDFACSFIHHPGRDEHRMSLITVLTGIAVRRVLYILTGESFEIKWPNDILCNGKKICGILVEKTVSGETPVLVIGIGINVNSTAQDLFPGSVSLRTISGRDFDIEEIISAINDELFSLITVNSIDDRLMAEWNGASTIIGKTVSFSGDGALSKGVVSGIDRNGALVIIDSDGNETHYNGEIDDVF